MRVSVQRLPVCGQVLPLSFVQFVSTGASLLRLNLIMRCMFVDAFDAFFVETCLGVWCFPLYICVFKVRSESGPSSASGSGKHMRNVSDWRNFVALRTQSVDSAALQEHLFLASVVESERIRLRKDHLPRVKCKTIKWI